MNVLAYDFLIRALVGAMIIGLVAPAVGVYLVQRRMSLIGDGIGHLALTGVAVGFLLGTAPVWTAAVVAALGAVAVELIRERGRASGDMALALMFYGGLAGGVLLTGVASGKSNANLMTYLFGSLLTTTPADLVVIGVLGGGVLALALLGRPWLFAISQDSEHAKVSGLPVRLMNVLLAIVVAVTVTVAMRAVGLLLVSALMVVPVAAAQQLARGFAATMAGAMIIGVVVAGCGVWLAASVDAAPGAAIVVLALVIFVIFVLAAGGLRRIRHR